MTGVLEVFHRGQRVGTLRQHESGGMVFAYDPGWQGSPSAFPVSLSLPLSGEFPAAAGHHFFANLLPEGNAREQICQELRISVGNDFGLLAAIGGDCAGALTVIPVGTPPPSPHPPTFEPISESELASWSTGTSNALGFFSGRKRVRLSLAGAQHKLPVCIDGERIVLPRGETPSTHILKFASPFYSHLPENEAFVSLLARHLGLPAVEVGLLKTANRSIALIERYDRQLVAGEYRRLHQEDFCQALGIPPSRKYEQEGGPGLRQCIDVIHQHCAYPLRDLQNLLRWALFNLLVGNADAHAKNLALLYDVGGNPGLAPFYDLVCTRNYRRVSRELAMSLGGTRDPDRFTERHLKSLAEDFGWRIPLVLNEVRQLSDSLGERLAETGEVFRTRFGNSPMLERLPLIIRRNLRRVRSQLRL
jgi:serine/threonine-protein kinase HipA